MARSRTCRDDRRRDHRRAESRTSDDAAGAGKSARAYFLTGKDVAAVGTRHQSTRPLRPALGQSCHWRARPTAHRDREHRRRHARRRPGSHTVGDARSGPGERDHRSRADQLHRDGAHLDLLAIAANTQPPAESFRSPVAGGSSTRPNKPSTSELSARTSADHCVPPRASARAGRPPRQAANGRSRTSTHADQRSRGICAMHRRQRTSADRSATGPPRHVAPSTRRRGPSPTGITACYDPPHGSPPRRTLSLLRPSTRLVPEEQHR